MATVSTPARQPFGLLNDSKIRSLQSVKNRQNAISTYHSSLKRRAPSPDISDSENVDPNLLDSLTKRKRGAFEDDVSSFKLTKPTLYTTTTVVSSVPSKLSHTTPISTPRINTATTAVITPHSAPAPATAAGRSPTRHKPSSSLSASRFHNRGRFVPPSMGSSKSSTLSITAALKGTLAHSNGIHKRAKTSRSNKSNTIEQSKPNSWFFDIFEETEETQDYRMNEWTMTQSSAMLDISDSDSEFSSSTKKQDRGKENIDPNSHSTLESIASVPVTRSMAASRATEAKLKTSLSEPSMSVDEEPRTPLADLNVTEYYAEGLNAASVVLVHDEDTNNETEAELVSPTDKNDTVETPSLPKEDFTFNAPITTVLPDWAVTSSTSIDAVVFNAPTNEDDSAIDIWESESAKDENEKHDADMQVAVDVQADASTCEGVFALQEL